MQKMHQSIFIQAPREKVWSVMLDEATYREWTTAFSPGSFYKGSWEKGSKILFLGPSQDGSSEMGMVSEIEESRPYEFVSIKHIGIVKDGVEDTQSAMAQKWGGAHENYTLREKDGGTELLVDLDIAAEEKAMMEGMWQRALLKLKELAESR